MGERERPHLAVRSARAIYWCLYLLCICARKFNGRKLLRRRFCRHLPVRILRIRNGARVRVESAGYCYCSTLTLGAHAQRGLLCKSVCPSVRLSVTTFSATTRNKAAKKRYQRVQCHTGLILKMAIFVKVLRSKVMA